MPPDNHTFVGRSLGRYQLLRVLGRGAMGVVYEGLDTRLARTVAIKTVQRSFLADEATAADYAARFEREAQAAARLHHPHIVALFDFGEQDDVSYIVMEYIRGHELAQAFRDGERFTLPQVQRLMAELLDALGAAHEHGIVHRDVKPANVLIDDQGRVKLADFGVARVVDSTQDRTMPGTMVGTPSAMAPEQILGLSVGSRTDIFSAGLICYQLLTGQRPFAGSGPFGVQRAIVHDEPQPPSAINAELPAAVDAVVARALAKKPEHRYETAAAFSAALSAALTPAATAALVPAATVALAPALVPAPAGQAAAVDGARPASAVDAAPASAGVDFDLDLHPAVSAAPPAVPAQGPPQGLQQGFAPAPPGLPASPPLSLPRPLRRWALPVGLAVAAVVLVGAGSWALRPRPVTPAAAAPTPPAAQRPVPTAPTAAAAATVLQAPAAPAPAPAVATKVVPEVLPTLAPIAAPAGPVRNAVPIAAPPAAPPAPNPPALASPAPGSPAAGPAAAAAAAPRPAPVRAADSKPRPPADARCAELLSRIQLGDSLTPEQTTLFHTRCAR